MAKLDLAVSIAKPESITGVATFDCKAVLSTVKNGYEASELPPT